MSARDPRLEEARRVLRGRGLAAGGARVEGHEREVLVLRLPEEEWDRMLEEGGREVVAALKALGFRYVSLDLETGPAGG